MRSTRELVLATFAIVAVVAGLHYWRTGRPSLITGTVIDLSTGRTVAGVRVRPKFLNGHGQGVFTDRRGRFTLPVSTSDGIGGLFVDDLHYAGLFGKTIGRESHAFREGEQDSGVIVPAIPAVELSGKVLDDDGHPISGCDIELLRPRSLHGPVRLVAANRNERTGPGGEYRFMRLDAGIYYLLAKCNGPSRTTHLRAGQGDVAPTEQNVWANLLYPHASKLSEAHAVITMPGQRIRNLDFRLNRVTGFLLKGRFIWVDGDSPQPRDVYSNDLLLTSLDLGLAQNQTESTCRWNTYPGEFECPQITPGSYRLTMFISPIWIEADRGHLQRQNDQGGEMKLHLRDEALEPVALEMHKIDPGARNAMQRTPTDTGWLEVQLSGCGSHDSRLKNFEIWDEKGRRAQVLSRPLHGRHAWQLELARGRYRVSATCRAYWGWSDNPYLEEVLAQKGAATEVRSARTTQLRVRALSTEEIYRVAVAHLLSLRTATN
jgi:hypothetical protein